MYVRKKPSQVGKLTWLVGIRSCCFWTLFPSSLIGAFSKFPMAASRHYSRIRNGDFAQLFAWKQFHVFFYSLSAKSKILLFSRLFKIPWVTTTHPISRALFTLSFLKRRLCNFGWHPRTSVSFSQWKWKMGAEVKKAPMPISLFFPPFSTCSTSLLSSSPLTLVKEMNECRSKGTPQKSWLNNTLTQSKYFSIKNNQGG